MIRTLTERIRRRVGGAGLCIVLSGYVQPSPSQAGAAMSGTISRTASRIFKRAGVYAVNGEKSRHATLHDLRRSFALRMKRIVRSPLDLQRLMRHEDINTTKDYYVGDDDEHLHESLWASHCTASQAVSEIPRRT